MRIETLILIFDNRANNVLFCKCDSPPYQGLLNLVGGMLENTEDGISGAYRELEEKAGITKNDVSLLHIMDLRYYLDDLLLHVYVGRLHKPASAYSKENDLFWVPIQHVLMPSDHFTGNGKLEHIMEYTFQMLENGKLKL